MLTGAGGNDTFVFHAGFGLDAVTDFTAGAAVGDVIQVDAALFFDFADIIAHASQVGANTVITLDSANSITLNNVTLANLNANDFLFV
jgi:Ca2+-binding RTX toxin-like protein